MIKRIKENKSRADLDQSRYDNDAALHCFAKDLPGEWHGSDAEALLENDVLNGRHIGLKPKELPVLRALEMIAS